MAEEENIGLIRTAETTEILYPQQLLESIRGRNHWLNTRAISQALQNLGKVVLLTAGVTLIAACSRSESNAETLKVQLTPPNEGLAFFSNDQEKPILVTDKKPDEAKPSEVLTTVPSEMTAITAPVSSGEGSTALPTENPVKKNIFAEPPPESPHSIERLFLIEPGQEAPILFPEADKVDPFRKISNGAMMYMSPEDADYFKKILGLHLKENPLEKEEINPYNPDSLVPSIQNVSFSSVIKSKTTLPDGRGGTLHTYILYRANETTIIMRVISDGKKVVSNQVEMHLNREGKATNKFTKDISGEELKEAAKKALQQSPENWDAKPGSYEAKAGEITYTLFSYGRVVASYTPQ